MWYHQLKTLDVYSLSTIEDCANYLAMSTLLTQTYDMLSLEKPKYLPEIQKALTRRIHDLDTDCRAYELSKIDAELALLQSPDEKRAQLLERKQTLEASLAV